MAGVRKLPYFNRKSAWVSRPVKRKSKSNNIKSYRVSIYTESFPQRKLVARAWFNSKEKANEWVDAFENGEDLPNTIIAKKEKQPDV